MGTEVLPPHDFLADRHRVNTASFYRRRNFPPTGNLANLIVNRKPSNNHTVNRKTSPRSDKKRSEPKRSTHGGRKDDGGLAMGQVTILRRGESLDSFTSKMNGGKSTKPKPADDMAVLGTNRIGPESPEMLPKQIRLSPPDIYAGSAFTLSPSPRALPLPSFFNKSKIRPLDDPATRDLRRLLRLD